MMRNRDLLDVLVLLALLGVLVSMKDTWRREPCSMDKMEEVDHDDEDADA